MWQPEPVILDKVLAKDLQALYLQQKEAINTTKFPYEEQKKHLYGKKSGGIYYIRLEKAGKYYYKIGFTTKAVFKRIDSLGLEGFRVEILQFVRFKEGYLAWRIEQYLHQKYKIYRINDSLLKEGNTEIYVKDVLGYEKHGRNVTSNYDTGASLVKNRLFNKKLKERGLKK